MNRCVPTCVAGLLAALVGGCGPLDITAARSRDIKPGPAWRHIPDRRITLSEPLAHSSRTEYVRFAWDDSGLYVHVMAFHFPPIRLSGPERWVSIAAGPSQPREPFGPLAAEAGYVHPETLTSLPKHWPAPGFTFSCLPCLWKPGQREADFYVPWKAFHSDGPLKEIQVTIGRTKRVLVLRR